MKHFLWMTGSFVLLMLLLVGAGEAYVRSQPNPSKAKHAYLSHHGDSVQVLVLGSSRTYYGVAPELLAPHTYNAAQVSQTLRYDDYMLRHYRLPNLRLVVQDLADFTFYEDFESGDDWPLAIRYRLYMDCPYHARLSRYGFEAAAFPQFAEKLKRLWQPARMHWSATGQGLEYTLKNRRPDWDNGPVRARKNTYEENANVALNERLLDDIWLRTVAHPGARLVLLGTPLRPGYRAAQQPQQMRAVQARVARFVATHPGTIYLDYTADARFGAADFYDSDHLSLEGSHHLTRLLARDLRQKLGHAAHENGRKALILQPTGGHNHAARTQHPKTN